MSLSVIEIVTFPCLYYGSFYKMRIFVFKIYTKLVQTLDCAAKFPNQGTAEVLTDKQFV